MFPVWLGPRIGTSPSGGVGILRTSNAISASPKFQPACSVLGVCWSSSQTYLPPVALTVAGHPPRPSPHRQMSSSCTPWFPMSPLPVSQNQCHVYLYLFTLYGFHCAGPRNISQLSPAGTGASGVCPIEKRRRKHSP